MRLLVVEDEHKVASFIKRGLEEAGHVVDVAYTGADGEYLASINSYDVMVLDCMLPDKDGRQVCRDLRARGNVTPALLLTAKDTTADKILGFTSGADQYLTKPFDFGELLARLRSLERHSKPPQMRSLDVADLQINPATRVVRRSNHEITLTAKEYLLLELLARRAGQVVTRTEIIEQVWDMHHDPMTNSVDVLVKHLRDKIDRDFEPKLIQTIRGVGYSLKPD
ncbi:MAG TPA: response regulator transcription factor [Pyrinomonadaceae bacterium]|nr:response regulator transcription factor [Pyrinomonadaceae bacterium]